MRQIALHLFALICGGAVGGYVFGALFTLAVPLVSPINSGASTYGVAIYVALTLGGAFGALFGVIWALFLGTPYALLQHWLKLGFLADIVMAVAFSIPITLAYARDPQNHTVNWALFSLPCAALATLSGVAAAYVYRIVIMSDRTIRLRVAG